MVFPLFWLISTSLRPAPELLAVPPSLLPNHWTIANFQKVFDRAPLLTYLWNSLVFATISTVFILVTSATAGLHLREVQVPGEQLPLHARARDGDRAVRDLHGPAVPADEHASGS